MINLLLCGNKRVFDGALTQLISMTNRTEEIIHVYIMTMDLRRLAPQYTCITEEQAAFLEKVIQEKHPQNKVTRLDVTELYEREFRECANEGAYCTPYTLLRLLADITPGIPDKILYLDIDIMIAGDIRELYDIDVSGVEYAAVKEKYGCWLIRPDYLTWRKCAGPDCFARPGRGSAQRRCSLPTRPLSLSLPKRKSFFPGGLTNSQSLTERTL